MTKEQLLEQAIGELAAELATMHGTFFDLITVLRHSRHTNLQDRLITQAEAQLKASQSRFLEKYADRIGGAAPENN
jgi:hypothetical protein